MPIRDRTTRKDGNTEKAGLPPPVGHNNKPEPPRMLGQRHNRPVVRNKRVPRAAAPTATPPRTTPGGGMGTGQARACAAPNVIIASAMAAIQANFINVFISNLCYGRSYFPII